MTWQTKVLPKAFVLTICGTKITGGCPLRPPHSAENQDEAHSNHANKDSSDDRENGRRLASSSSRCRRCCFGRRREGGSLEVGAVWLGEDSCRRYVASRGCQDV